MGDATPENSTERAEHLLDVIAEMVAYHVPIQGAVWPVEEAVDDTNI